MIPFILVHIGTEFFPDYAPDAVRQICTWNPNNSVFFICERKFFSAFDSIDAPNFYIVDINQISASEQHLKFNKNTRLDTSFRNGFWRFTTERLYILYDFMLSESIPQCIHIENDNTIYFSTEDPAFKSAWDAGSDLCAPRHGAKSLTFGILFCKNLDSLAKLCDTFAATPTNINEMDLGYMFFKNNPGITSFLSNEPLPTPAADSQLLFDAACYGQFLGGIDPRNGPSRPGFVNRDSFFSVNDPSLSYFWKRDDAGRKYPVIRRYIGQNNSVLLRIANLHIHSKNLVPFLSDIPIHKGEDYQIECDAWFGISDDIAYNNNIIPYFNGKFTETSPERVFVYAHRLSGFDPNEYEKPFTLVTHNSDENITSNYDHIFDHPKIKEVYSQNLLTTHPKCKFIPIGQANRQWVHGNTAILLRIIEATRNIPKTNFIYLNFCIDTNISERQPVMTIMEKKGIPHIPNLEYASYLTNLSTFKYCICPPGNGVDTHRIWECFYLGVTPIVVRNPLITHIESAGYKMIILNSWDELDPASLP